MSVVDFILNNLVEGLKQWEAKVNVTTDNLSKLDDQTSASRTTTTRKTQDIHAA